MINTTLPSDTDENISNGLKDKQGNTIEITKESDKNGENIINSIVEYMENKLKIGEDISYEWIQKDANIQFLNNSIKTDLINLKTTIEKRDLSCELKLLKLITEDKKHREKLIDLPKNMKKYNRYTDILPYSGNAVFLNEENKLSGSSYINASYISGPFEEDQDMFIASQGPLNLTIEVFWKLVMQKGIKLVVMLSNLLEEGRKKCEMYWPKDTGSPIIFEKFRVVLESQVFILDDAVMQRNIIVIDEENNKEFTVTQLHATRWPDHSVPEEEIGFKMVDLLLTYIDDFKTCYSKAPILIHCSAGIGRTGTFIAIYNLTKCLSKISNYNRSVNEKLQPFFSVFNAVRKLREQRFGMVTDTLQYGYIYHFIVEWLKRNFEI